MKQIPELNLEHLRGMTDSFGMFQHAKFASPNKRTGYALDDNARALIAAVQLKEFGLAEKYLRFIKFCQHSSGKFYNKVTWKHEKKHSPTIGDCFGRTVWACGFVLGSKAPKRLKNECKKIFGKAKRFFPELHDAKTISYCILGCVHYLNAKNPPKAFLQKQINAFGNVLAERLEAHSQKNWIWFENILSYCNAKVPEALFKAYLATGSKKFLEAGEKSFDFLAKRTFYKNCFVPIGQEGWCRPNGFRSFFDQQPVEAGTMTEAAVSGFLATKNPKFKKIAENSFAWFFGNNLTKETVYYPETGAVFDGIAANTINENRGAESLLTYLLARSALKTIK